MTMDELIQEAVRSAAHEAASRLGDGRASAFTPPRFDGDTGTASCTIYEADGTRSHYQVAITVTKTIDSNDAYWDDQARSREGALVADGVHYRIGADNKRPYAHKGFGGRSWRIRRLDNGAEFTVDDLWYQGPIPPAHRGRPEFRDNVEFLDGAPFGGGK